MAAELMQRPGLSRADAITVMSCVEPRDWENARRLVMSKALLVAGRDWYIVSLYGICRRVLEYAAANAPVGGHA